MAAAKTAGMPGDTIDRAVKKGAGELEGVSYEEVTYEGHAPGGAAIMLQTLTDNKTEPFPKCAICSPKAVGAWASPTPLRGCLPTRALLP